MYNYNDLRYGKYEEVQGPEAVEDWLSSLVPSRDYNATGWRCPFIVAAEDSLINTCGRCECVQATSSTLNFAMVGACDGLADPAIRDRFYQINTGKQCLSNL